MRDHRIRRAEACKPLLLKGSSASSTGGTTRRARAARGGRARVHPRGREPPEAEAERRAQQLRRRRPGSDTRAGRRTAASRSQNAHPLTGCDDGAMSIVLNGIVENYRELKESLVADGHTFSSETDAEVVAHLIERHYDGDLVAAFRERLRAARGALLDRRHPPRPPGHPRRRSLPDAVGRRRRGRRDVPGILDRRVPARDAPRAVHRRPPGRRAPPGGCDLPRRGRRNRPARGDRDRLGRRERGEVGLRDVHAQGDLRAARGDPRDDRRPRPRPAADPRGPRPHRARDPEPPADRHRRLRQRLPRRRRRPLHHRGVGAPAGRARHRQRMDLPQPRVDEGHAGDRDLAVRARRATRSTR